MGLEGSDHHEHWRPSARGMFIYSVVPLLAAKRGPSPLPQFPRFHFCLLPTLWTLCGGSVCESRGLTASHLARRAPGLPQLVLGTGGFVLLCGEMLPCAPSILVFPGNAPREGLQGTPLPNPNISFHLWTEDEQLCECPGAGGAGWGLSLEVLSQRGHLALTLGQGVLEPLSQGQTNGDSC